MLIAFRLTFCFSLHDQEVTNLRCQIGTSSSKLVDDVIIRHVFTEHGAIMAAAVLNSPRAVEMSVQVVRAFVRLREMLASNRELAQKLAELERKLEGHDAAIRNLFEAIRQLLNSPEPPRKQIGFHVKESKARYAVKLGKRSGAQVGSLILSPFFIGLKYLFALLC